MPTMTPLETAAAELQAAADLAVRRAQGNPLDPWSAMAGTIRLIASGLDPMPPTTSVAATDLHAHLTAAGDALDQLPTDESPSDLAFWRAHVLDLAENARDLDARPRSTVKAPPR
ncbi:MAG: hypothetical protein JF622_17400 [Terrabacter sp.]|nr:hypothetical protein [Terrabacter sp.]